MGIIYALLSRFMYARQQRRQCGHRTTARVAFRRPWPGTRRGLKLWLIAIIVGMKGWVHIVSESASVDAALRFLVAYLNVPVRTWGVVIVAVCVFAAFTSYCHHGRDRNGFRALAGLAGANAGLYFAGWVLLDAPETAGQGALSWLLIGGFVLLIAADPEPADLERIRDAR